MAPHLRVDQSDGYQLLPSVGHTQCDEGEDLTVSFATKIIKNKITKKNFLAIQQLFTDGVLSVCFSTGLVTTDLLFVKTYISPMRNPNFCRICCEIRISTRSFTSITSARDAEGFIPLPSPWNGRVGLQIIGPHARPVRLSLNTNNAAIKVTEVQEALSRMGLQDIWFLDRASYYSTTHGVYIPMATQWQVEGFLRDISTLHDLPKGWCASPQSFLPPETWDPIPGPCNGMKQKQPNQESPKPVRDNNRSYMQVLVESNGTKQAPNIKPTNIHTKGVQRIINHKQWSKNPEQSDKGKRPERIHPKPRVAHKHSCVQDPLASISQVNSGQVTGEMAEPVLNHGSQDKTTEHHNSQRQGGQSNPTLNTTEQLHQSNLVDQSGVDREAINDAQCDTHDNVDATLQVIDGNVVKPTQLPHMDQDTLEMATEDNTPPITTNIKLSPTSSGQTVIQTMSHTENSPPSPFPPSPQSIPIIRKGPESRPKRACKSRYRVLPTQQGDPVN